ncbi:MAG: hypothetical protein PHF67_04535, partial [Candidatus Nanoarchaeia archaeon]|nr:hypothetical protein [Candidatus Nanoarchaeia archaeon]
MDYEIVVRKKSKAPNFVARANCINERIPFRTYVHESGIEQAFPIRRRPIIEQAINHSFYKIEQALDSIPGLTNNNYFISIVWGSEGNPMIDLIGFSGLDFAEEPKNWPGNPEITSFVFKNGIYQ